MKQILLKTILLLVGFSIFSGGILTAAVVPSTTVTGTSNPGNEVPSAMTIKEAMSSLKNLSHKEKRERLKDVKKELKEYKKLKRSGDEPSTNTLLLVILAIILPPLAVYLHQGEINNKFWISLLLTLLFWIPGVIYSLLVVLGEI